MAVDFAINENMSCQNIPNLVNKLIITGAVKKKKYLDLFLENSNQLQHTCLEVSRESEDLDFWFRCV